MIGWLVPPPLPFVDITNDNFTIPFAPVARAVIGGTNNAAAVGGMNLASIVGATTNYTESIPAATPWSIMVSNLVAGATNFLTMTVTNSAGTATNDTIEIYREPQPPGGMTSNTYNLGTSPSGTVFATSGAASLFSWIAKGTLPVGSILRSISAINVKLEDNPNGTWASDIGVFVDPDPSTPGGPGGLLSIGDDSDYGGAAETMDWHGNGQNDGPFSETMLAGSDFSTAIDLHDAEVYLGNGYGDGPTFSGTITVEYDAPTPAKMVAFGLPGDPATITGNDIAWTVPHGTDVTNLAPTYTLSSGTCIPASGSTNNFTSPVIYTVADMDLFVVNVYTVTVTVAGLPDELNVSTYIGIDGQSYLDPISNLMTRTATATSTTTTRIDYHGSGFASLPGAPGPDHFSVLWEGWFNVAKDGTGVYTFGTSSDDGSVLCLDLNGDGDFTGAGEMIVNNNNYQGDTAATGEVDLNMKSVHMVIGFYQGGGGYDMRAAFKKGSGLGFGGLNLMLGNAAGCFSTVDPYAVPDAKILTFGPGAAITVTNIAWEVPYGSDVTSLSPTYTLSFGATCDKASGSTHNFTNPVTYTVVSSDNLVTNVYTVTVSVTPASSAKQMLTFGPGAVINGTTIAWRVPYGSDVTTLSPTYTVSEFATGNPASGTTRDFTTPRTYTVIAQNGSSNIYTVTVTISAASWINVNMDATPQSGLVGPAGGSGATWNDVLSCPCDVSGLLDYSGNVTSVRVQCTADGLDPWGNPPLTMLRSAARNFGWSTPYQLIISGLNTANKYDLYIAGYYPNESGSIGQYVTTNITSSSVTNFINNGGPGGINDAWVDGTNYVAFFDMVPDAAGFITIDIVGLSGCRAMVSGFQLLQNVSVVSNPSAVLAFQAGRGADYGQVSLSWSNGLITVLACTNRTYPTDPTDPTNWFELAVGVGTPWTHTDASNYPSVYYRIVCGNYTSSYDVGKFDVNIAAGSIAWMSFPFGIQPGCDVLSEWFGQQLQARPYSDYNYPSIQNQDGPGGAVQNSDYYIDNFNTDATNFFPNRTVGTNAGYVLFLPQDHPGVKVTGIGMVSTNNVTMQIPYKSVPWVGLAYPATIDMRTSGLPGLFSPPRPYSSFDYDYADSQETLGGAVQSVEYYVDNWGSGTTNFFPSAPGADKIEAGKGYLLFFSTSRAGTGTWTCVKPY